jgi:hypothetical protein
MGSWWGKLLSVLVLAFLLPGLQFSTESFAKTFSPGLVCTHGTQKMAVSAFTGSICCDRRASPEEASTPEALLGSGDFLGLTPAAKRWIALPSDDIVLSVLRRCGRLCNLPPPTHA